MSENSSQKQFPGSEGDETIQRSQIDPAGSLKKENRLWLLWQGLFQVGLGEAVFRYGTHVLSIGLVLLVVWLMSTFYLRAKQVKLPEIKQVAAMAAPLTSPTPLDAQPDLPIFASSIYTLTYGIPRLAYIHTDIPTLPRTDVMTYTVMAGDTIFGIAQKFNLKPETILWGNTYILGDNPEFIRPGLVLNILPENGVYHKWSAGEGLNGVAKYYGVSPETIVDYPGNHLDPNVVGDFAKPNIPPGAMLIVPGGKRAFISWTSVIPRSNPAKARIMGPGACGSISSGAVGTGSFVWPANNHYLSGFDYSPSTNHMGIDIAGGLGAPIYAADTGVVVYAGWNNWGYGNVVVVDHGNGWQTLYAHMSALGVGCGQSVDKGSQIGNFGSTGNSSGPHLHFEMYNDKYGKVNPWNFLP